MKRMELKMRLNGRRNLLTTPVPLIPLGLKKDVVLILGAKTWVCRSEIYFFLKSGTRKKL